MNIVTLTLNPAFDLHCFAENFQPFHENLARITALDAGGKGINISRALAVSGVPNVAVAVLGRDNGDLFRRALKEDGIDYREITVEGRIRENMTLHTDHAPETRISFAGFSADDRLIEKVERELDGLLEAGDILTFTGRLPEGVGIARVKRMLKTYGDQGVRIVLDSRSFEKSDLIEVRPWLIKPNEEEIRIYADDRVEDFQEAKRAAQTLRSAGIENVMISLGGRGAILCCAEGCYVAYAPKIEVVSTVGAGDSAIGGFCAAATAGATYADMLRHAVAYGSAACMTEGTRPPCAKHVRDLLSVIVSEKL
ncbi:MAG: 1-phosphofructokinase family hexose kinase [Clostridia bacterium]|nr:1-phosphofructokinase family hexose kinase [Clostridia bacterium]